MMMADTEAGESRDAVADAVEVVLVDEDVEDNTRSNLEETQVATCRLS